MIIHRRSALTLLAASPLLALPRSAAAQSYPTRPIHLIVPYPPGGPTDVVARILANSLGAKLGQTIVVDNRPGGAAGTVGAHVVVSADPDGYTILLNQAGSLTIAPSLYKLDYDPLKAFAPIGIVASSPEILVVHPSVPAKSIPEFIAYAKSNPGKINFGTPGTGTLPHLVGSAVSTRREHQGHRRALSGRGPGSRRSAGRPNADDDRQHVRAACSHPSWKNSARSRSPATSGSRNCRICRHSPRLVIRS